MLEVIGSDGEAWYAIDAPILGVIRECQQDASSWHGILPDGRALEVRSAVPGVQARMPDDGCFRVRASDGQLYPIVKDVFEGRLLGVYLIERKRKRSRRR
jgi:hypothetical protein